MSDDCRNCFHNTYRAIKDCAHFDCSHPVTQARGPRWQSGDPAMVSFRTSDVPLRDIEYFSNCPTWEPAPAPTDSIGAVAEPEGRSA